MTEHECEACAGDALGIEGILRVQSKVAADIEQVGWSAIGVFPDETNSDMNPFCYSVGFTEMGHPEMIVYGMPFEQMWGILKDAYNAIMDGHNFKDEEVTALLCGPPYKVVIRAVPGDGHPANVARMYYDEDIALLQAVWPDSEHRFPWDEDYSDKQVVLALEPDHPDLKGVDDDGSDG